MFQKFGNDQAGALASRIAYHGLFSLFPLLLLFTTILGYVLSGHPALRQHVIDSALGNFPIIGTQLRHTNQSLGGNAAAVAVGIGGLVYGSLGVSQSAQAAMNEVWNIPYVEWPNFFLRRARGLAVIAVLGVSLLASGALAAAAGAVFGGVATPIAFAGSVLVNFGVFLAAFLVLTAENLGWRDVVLGAVLSTVFWEVLLSVGGLYVRHALAHASDTYGFFAIVIALLSWIYLAAQLTLLAAEINVVRKYHLWPRSITQPPLTDGDRAVFERLARMQTRRPEYEVRTRFLPTARHDPLAAAEADAAAAAPGDGAPTEPADRPDDRPPTAPDREEPRTR